MERLNAGVRTTLVNLDVDSSVRTAHMPTDAMETAVTLPGLATYSGEAGFIQVSVGDTLLAVFWLTEPQCVGVPMLTVSLVWQYNGLARSAYTAMPESASFTNWPWKAHSCAANYSGELFCWSPRPFGQLGDGTINNRLSPSSELAYRFLCHVSLLVVIIHVSFSCSQPACWGRNTGSTRWWNVAW